MQPNEQTCCCDVVVTGKNKPSQGPLVGVGEGYALARGLFGAPVTTIPQSPLLYDKPETFSAWKVTPAQAALVVARAVGGPVEVERIGEQVGRFVMVWYTPVRRPDPDVIVMVGSKSAVVNRVMGRLQAARQDWLFDPGAWYARVDALVATLRERLIAVRATAEEFAFVMTWAQQVRDSGRTIAPRGMTWTM